MLKITEAALKELNTFFEGKEKQAIRIYLAPGGCQGPRLALALDEPLDEDTTVEEGGFTFCVNKELLEETTGISIDVSYMGFVVEPNKPFPNTGGCSSCSSCGTGGSGGCAC